MNPVTKKCPMCAEQIPLDATVCEYCGTKFDEGQQAVGVQDVAIGRAGTGETPAEHLSFEPQTSVSIPLAPTATRSYGFWNYAIIVLVIVGLMGGIGIIAWLTAPSTSPVPTVAPTATRRPTTTPNYAATQKVQSTRAAATAEFAWVQEFAQPILNDVHNHQPNFEDNFSDRNGRFVRWGEEQGVTFTNGVMRINTSDRGWVGAGGMMIARDFVLEFDFTPRIISDDCGISVNFRAGDPGGYNFGFNLHDSWWGMGSLPAGQDYRVVADGWSAQVALNRKTSVTIIAKGDHFAFYANGKPLLFVINTQFSGNWVDLGVWSPNNPAEVDFDNVKFWDLNNPMP